MIRFNNVSKTYPGGFLALKQVSFSLAAGEMAFLTGHSGAGKSTLLKLMSLMEKPTSGSIRINGKELSDIKYHQIPYVRRGIGMIFQSHNLLMDRTVFDNVALPLIIEGYSHKETRKRVEAALDKVHLTSKLRCFPYMLSGGEQQRVGIARAIVNKPPILLADEPTGNLDPKLSLDIIRLFANKEPDRLRTKLKQLQRDAKVKKIERKQYLQQQYEILLALQKLGDKLNSEEQSFIKQYQSRGLASAAQLSSMDATIKRAQSQISKAQY